MQEGLLKPELINPDQLTDEQWDRLEENRLQQERVSHGYGSSGVSFGDEASYPQFQQFQKYA